MESDHIKVSKLGAALWLVGSALVAALAANSQGCGSSNDPDDEVAASTGATAHGGAGGTGAGGKGGAGAASSTGTGASGGAGNGGSDCGTGGQGGARDLPCLDPTMFAADFTIQDPKLCVVAIYDSDVEIGYDDATFYTAIPGWGRHGGPVLAKPAAGGNVDLVRLTPPAGGSGAMTEDTASIPAAIPAGTYLGSQAIDLPFFDWTALSYSTDFGTPGGEVLLVDASGKVEQKYAVNALYAGAGLGACAAGRLLYSGLSTVDEPMPGANAFYAADSCGTKGKDARLLPYGDATCGSPIEVAAWGDASGPVAVDSAGNAIAVMVTLDMNGDSTNDVRGFEAKTIARGAAPTMGSPLFTKPGYGGSLGAIAPSGSDSGIVAFQPTDDTTFLPTDALEQRYTVGADVVTAVGTPATLFKPTVPGTQLWFFGDPHDRLWVAVSTAMGSRFLVVTRAP